MMNSMWYQQTYLPSIFIWYTTLPQTYLGLRQRNFLRLYYWMGDETPVSDIAAGAQGTPCYRVVHIRGSADEEETYDSPTDDAVDKDADGNGGANLRKKRRYSLLNKSEFSEEAPTEQPQGNVGSNAQEGNKVSRAGGDASKVRFFVEVRACCLRIACDVPGHATYLRENQPRRMLAKFRANNLCGFGKPFVLLPETGFYGAEFARRKERLLRMRGISSIASSTVFNSLLPRATAITSRCWSSSSILILYALLAFSVFLLCCRLYSPVGGGELICCDTCIRAYHMSVSLLLSSITHSVSSTLSLSQASAPQCLPPRHRPLEDSAILQWSCPVCTYFRVHDTLEQRRGVLMLLQHPIPVPTPDCDPRVKRLRSRKYVLHPQGPSIRLILIFCASSNFFHRFQGSRDCVRGRQQHFSSQQHKEIHPPGSIRIPSSLSLGYQKTKGRCGSGGYGRDGISPSTSSLFCSSDASSYRCGCRSGCREKERHLYIVRHQFRGTDERRTSISGAAVANTIPGNARKAGYQVTVIVIHILLPFIYIYII
eukprot:284819607_2